MKIGYAFNHDNINKLLKGVKDIKAKAITRELQKIKLETITVLLLLIRRG
jgi:hypothetical protein